MKKLALALLLLGGGTAGAQAQGTPVSPVISGMFVSSSNPLPVGGAIGVTAGSFTRPADTTAYASGDLVANSTTAGSVTPIPLAVCLNTGASVSVRRVRLWKSGTSITNTSFRLHLYTVSPTVANGDNGAWSSSQAATYAGSVDVTMDKAFTDGAAGQGTPSVGAEINMICVAQTVYGLLEARAAYTPTSAEVFSVAVETWQN